MKTISKTTAALVSFFFGLFGIHRLLMGYKNWWIMPMTLGGVFIWHLYDLTSIMTGKMKMADGTPLKE